MKNVPDEENQPDFNEVNKEDKKWLWLAIGYLAGIVMEAILFYVTHRKH